MFVQINSIHDLISQKPYLAWYVKDVSQLSAQSILEHVLNYGSWEDVQTFIQLYGIKQTAQLFEQLHTSTRQNLLPEINHYFRLYFAAHVA